MQSRLTKSTLLALLTVVPLVLSACATSSNGADESASTQADEAPPIIFGFTGPLTGPTSAAGEALLQGAEQRVAELNEAGGIDGRKIELVTCDDQSTPAVGVACVNRLVTQDGIDVLVNTLHSPIVLATAEILERNEVPSVGAGVGDYCTKGYDYLFRGTTTDAVNVKTLGDALTALEIARVGTLYQNDEFGVSGADALKGLPGITEVTRQAFAPGDLDWTGQIINLVNENPDAIAVWGLGQDMGPITKQLREQGWDGPIIGSASYTFPGAMSVALETADGVLFASPYYIPEEIADYPSARIREFLTNFQATHSALPASDNAYRAYDAVGILAEAIKQAKSTEGRPVMLALHGISDYEGLGGTFDFAQFGCDGLQASSVFEIENLKILEFDGKLATP
jgi:branched-chain amino acid transport system substrate-binding protein